MTTLLAVLTNHLFMYSDLDMDPDDGNNSLYTFRSVAGAITPMVLEYFSETAFRVLLYAGGAIHLIITLWFVVEYIIVNWPNFRAPRFVYRILSKLVI